LSKSKKLVVVKANSLLESCYKLNLNEQRCLLMAISKVDSKQSLEENREFTIEASKFGEAFNINNDKSFQALFKAVKMLNRKPLQLSADNPEEYTWFKKVTYVRGEGHIKYIFNDLLAPFLTLFKKGEFAQFNLNSITNFKSVYGIRIFEMLNQWKKTGYVILEIENLKKRLMIKPNQYAKFSDFRKFCIEKAMKDINDHSPFQIDNIEYTKRGKTVSHVAFKFSYKKTNKEKLEETKNAEQQKKIENLTGSLKHFLDETVDMKLN
jgi:plasmid replication initiation protein